MAKSLGKRKSYLKMKNRNIDVNSKDKRLSQTDLAKFVGVSRNTVSSIETGQYQPSAKLALLICIALDKKFEEIFDIVKAFSHF